jgi:DNA-binding MarR family transcriptional regulator
MTELDFGQRFAMAIGRLGRQARQRTPSGLTPSQVSTLGSLSRLGEARVSDLAAAEGVALPVMTRLIVSLEELGLVARGGSESDKRAVLVHLTDAGRAQLAELMVQRSEWAAGIVEILSPAERETLTAALPVLEKLAGN